MEACLSSKNLCIPLIEINPELITWRVVLIFIW